MAKELKITLVRSTIGTKPLQRKTIEALGLTKIRQSVTKPDNPQVRGMLNKVGHLVDVEEQ